MTITGANFIDGSWVPADSGKVFERRNPADDSDLIGTFPDSDVIDVQNAVDALDKAAPDWAATPPERRAAILEAAAEHLAANADTLVEELIREEGKTRAEASMEVSRTPMNLRFYAGEAHRATGTVYPGGGPTTVYTVREPIGIVGAITPWNFPLNIPSRKLGPALAAGNTVLFKPSEITPLMGQRLVEALLAGGLPPDAIALVQGDGKAGAAVVGDERVAAVTFTGSTSVGRAIHRASAPNVACNWRWAERTPSSCLPTPTSTLLRRSSSKARSDCRDKPAPAPAASSRSTRSTMRCSTEW